MPPRWWPCIRPCAVRCWSCSAAAAGRPGLVADGRDMGTVVFPDAGLKVFLTASVQARAERRHKQLMEKGISTNIADLSQELEARDRRDTERSTAPLRPAEDAYRLDSSDLSVDEVVAQVLHWYDAQRRRPVNARTAVVGSSKAGGKGSRQSMVSQ